MIKFFHNLSKIHRSHWSHGVLLSHVARHGAGLTPQHRLRGICVKVDTLVAGRQFLSIV